MTPRALTTPRAFLVLAGALTVLLACEVAARVVFPWDILTAAESPFMTDMLKLAHSQSLYRPPEECNSYTYAPGLPYLTYWLLQPLGLHLNVIYCRVVSVLLGLLACVLAAGAAQRLGRLFDARLALSQPDLQPSPAGAEANSGSMLGRPANHAAETRAAAPGFLLAFLLALLVVFRSTTSESPHPDNLQLLHALATFWLCYRAATRADFVWALLAVGCAGLGVLAQQTAALAWVGAGVGLVASGRWGRTRGVLLFALGGGVAAGSLAGLNAPEYGWFYTFQLPQAQGFHLAKVAPLLAHVAGAPHRLILWGVAPFAFVHLWRSNPPRVRTFLRLWLALGLTAVLPSLLAFLKAAGASNHLTLADLWLFLLVWPVLQHSVTIRPSPGATPQPEGHARPGPGLERFGPWVLTAGLILALAPAKLPPKAIHYASNQRLEDCVAADLAAGRQVLLANGTMHLIRQGVREAPWDRFMSLLELQAGRKDNLAGTVSRLERQYYDRVYADFLAFDPRLEKALEDNYRVLDRLPNANLLGRMPLTLWTLDYEGLMFETRVLEPDPDALRKREVKARAFHRAAAPTSPRLPHPAGPPGAPADNSPAAGAPK